MTVAVRTASAALFAAALAGCASMQSRIDAYRPAAQIAPGTSSSPSQPWTPPADAVPPPLPSLSVTMPENVAPGTRITLAQIVDVALSNNPQTRAAWLNARAAEAQLGSARSAYLPEVDLNASLTYGRGSGEGAHSSTQFGTSLGLTYLLFDFGGREAAVEQARQALIAADFQHNQTIQDVVLQAQQAYYDYLDAKALLSAQDATLKERKTSLDAAEARHNAGVATIADVLQARTAYSEARLTYDTIQGNLRIIEGQVATVMGLPSTAVAFELGDLPSEIPTQVVGQAVDALIARAVAERPDLAAARAEVERAGARVQAIRAQGLPSIGLTAGVGEDLTNGFNRNTTPYSAGIAMRFPLFTGWRNTYDVRAAELDRQLAAENARGLEQRVNLQVWTSYYALQTAVQRLATVRDLLASAQQSADVARSRYKAGVGSILDLLTAESALEQARAQEVQARADWFLAVAQLAHDTGTLGVTNR